MLRERYTLRLRHREHGAAPILAVAQIFEPRSLFFLARSCSYQRLSTSYESNTHETLQNVQRTDY